MSNRVEEVVSDIVKSVQDSLVRNNVTFEEYRAGVAYLMSLAEAPEYEIPLLCDVWFNQTICDIENTQRVGSDSNLEGPFFLEDVPAITNRILTKEGQGEPLIIRGHVQDLEGAPLVGATMDVWHSDPDGHYTGFDAQDVPTDHYRGRLVIGDDGLYEIHTTKPAPYTIPNDGPTGGLLAAMGRHPWRPAHVHFKIRKPGFYEHISQAYFAGEEYIDDDCVDGVREPNVHSLDRDGDTWLLNKEFNLDPVS